MRLFIAKKPSLGRAIAENLGKGVSKDGCIEINNGQDIVTWCFGHILEQYDPGEYDERYKKWLTYSPRLKPGDSWIQTAFAYSNVGLTMPLQRRLMPQPSRCSLRRFCPDYERHRNADTSILGRANLSFPDSARRRYGRFVSSHSTDLSFECSFLFCSPDVREFSQTPQSRSPRSFCPIVSAFPSGSSPQCTQERIPRRSHVPA